MSREERVAISQRSHLSKIERRVVGRLGRFPFWRALRLAIRYFRDLRTGWGTE